MKLKKHKIVEYTYKWLKYAIVILYVIGLFGIWTESGKYLTLIDNVFKIIISGILIYFFNPFTKTVCVDFHRNVAFSAGFAILLQTSFVHFINPEKFVKKKFNNFF